MSLAVTLGSTAPRALESWCKELPNRLSTIPKEQILHRARNVLFRDTIDDATAVVAKIFGRTTRSLLCDRWRGSKAQRSFLIAEALAERGIATPEPLAWAEWRTGPLLLRSVYVCRAVSDAKQLHWWLRDSDGRQETIAAHRREQAGELIGRAHRAGILHRDLSPGNLVFGACGSNEPQWHLVDLNRTRFGQVPDLRSGAAWLARLCAHQPGHQLDLLRGYAQAWDQPVDEALAGWHQARRGWLQRSRLQRRTRQARRDFKRRLRA